MACRQLLFDMELAELDTKVNALLLGLNPNQILHSHEQTEEYTYKHAKKQRVTKTQRHKLIKKYYNL